MKTIIALIIFLVIGLIGARGWVSRAMARSPLAGLFLTGIEFFFVGIFLGPSFLNIISYETQEDLKPIIYLALGWTGLLFGIQLSWHQIKRVSKSVFKMIAIDSSVVTIIFAGIIYLFLSYIVPDVSRVELIFSSIIFAITASVSSPTIIAVLSRRLPSRGKFTSTVKIISSLNAIFPLLVFGLFFITTHPSFLGKLGIGYGLLWWIFANAVGIILGFVMVLLTIQRCSEDERLLLIMGIVMIAGGLCYYFKLSSLYTAMLMGIVVGNFSRRRDHIFKQLVQIEKTLFIMFLIMVGAMIEFRSPYLVQILIFYFVLRLLLKTVVSRGALVRYFPEFCKTGRKCGLVFVGQGGMALAMVLDYRLSAGGIMAETVTSAIVLAVVLNEITGFNLTKVALRASGDIEPRGEGGAHN